MSTCGRSCRRPPPARAPPGARRRGAAAACWRGATPPALAAARRSVRTRVARTAAHTSPGRLPRPWPLPARGARLVGARRARLPRAAGRTWAWQRRCGPRRCVVRAPGLRPTGHASRACTLRRRSRPARGGTTPWHPRCLQAASQARTRRRRDRARRRRGLPRRACAGACAWSKGAAAGACREGWRAGWRRAIKRYTGRRLCAAVAPDRLAQTNFTLYV
jgi:hypothetical protein